MLFREAHAFDVVHGRLNWPWIAFAAGGIRVAYASSSSTIATGAFASERLDAGPAFALPSDLTIASGGGQGLASFTLGTDGTVLAVTGIAAEGAVVATIDASGERRRARVEDLVGPGHAVHAIAFDRSGGRIWVSLESATETVLVLLDAASLTKIDVLRSPAFPRPALHELHLHPHDDAVLLVAACGEQGTFARVVGFAGGVTSAISTGLDAGSIAAGLVGFSGDGARVHLAEADELRTHAWPGLEELSSVPFADDFVSSFSGAVVGHAVLVDGEDAETRDDAVMLFDRSAIHGEILDGPVPNGMWAGHLKPDAIVTIEAKGDPARARVWRATTRI